MNNALISQKALLEGFDVHKVTEYDESGCGVDYRAVPVDAIMKAPAVYAEPVRRCNQCKHYETDTGFCNYHGHGMHWDDFCSRSAKLDGGDNNHE